MKRENVVSKVASKVIVGVVVGAVALMGILPVPVPAALAADAGTVPVQTGSDFKKMDDTLFEYALKRLQNAVAGQQIRLDMMSEVTTEAQGWIDELKGKDTSALETALAKFKDGIKAGQAAHDNAKSILDTHAGFDSDGKVTDKEQARQTLRAVRDGLKQTHEILRSATEDLRDAVRTYRQANRPEKPEENKTTS